MTMLGGGGGGSTFWSASDWVVVLGGIASSFHITGDWRQFGVINLVQGGMCAWSCCGVVFSQKLTLFNMYVSHIII